MDTHTAQLTARTTTLTCRSSQRPGHPHRTPHFPTAVLALVIAAVATWPTAAAEAARSCGTFKDADGARIAVRVLAGNTTCTNAKRILRNYDRTVTPQRCASNACPATVQHYRCSSATTTAFPRLFSCQRSRIIIAAYSTAE